ncbi:hypothetical protein Plhal304r1_c031g0101711 [Plasmopara halstedii]
MDHNNFWVHRRSKLHSDSLEISVATAGNFSLSLPKWTLAARNSCVTACIKSRIDGYVSTKRIKEPCGFDLISFLLNSIDSNCSIVVFDLIQLNPTLPLHPAGLLDWAS